MLQAGRTPDTGCDTGVSSFAQSWSRFRDHEDISCAGHYRLESLLSNIQMTRENGSFSSG